MGFLGPVFILGIVFLMLNAKKAGIQKQADERAKVFAANKRSAIVTKGLQEQIKTYEARMENWEQILEESDVGTVTGILKEISNQHGSGEKFRQNDFKFVNQKTGVGSVSGRPNVTYNLSLDGTYQTLQKSILILESKLPNLHLNTLKLTPQKDGPLLNAELSYTAWTN